MRILKALLLPLLLILSLIGVDNLPGAPVASPGEAGEVRYHGVPRNAWEAGR